MMNKEQVEKNKANLINADLMGADLRNVKLRNAKLMGADLRNANLINADLRNVKLMGADIREADLRNADLLGADIRNMRYNFETTGIQMVPPEGTIIGWKKIKNCLIKLQIPAEAKRSSATSRKCRCEFAIVLDIVNLKTNSSLQELQHSHYKSQMPVIYRTGTIVVPDAWDNNRWNECSHGIHFFLDKTEALEWAY